MSSCPRARGYIPLISALKGGVCTLRIQSKIIEIGCGTGYYGLFLHDKCKEYIGVDITSENINLFNEKIEQEKIQNIITIVGDGTNLKGINSKTLSQ
jgi:tRNA1(Val) A37 N6-methylase TrmN6